MNLIYILIFIAVVWIELDSRINTDNIIEKIGLCLIGVGALASIDSQNNLIACGILIYFSSIAHKVYRRRKRASDKRETAHRPV